MFHWWHGRFMFCGLLLLNACGGGAVRSNREGTSAGQEDAAATDALAAEVPFHVSDVRGAMDTSGTQQVDDAAGDMVPLAICGNLLVEDGETCDDGNSAPGDGCSGLCRIEPNFICPVAGAVCTATIVCGDSKVQGSEACDDGNVAASDGCSPVCQVEPGFACATPGARCTPVVTAKCGDGAANQGEQCDDGNEVSGDGCSATCKLEPGWSCPAPNKPCIRNEFCADGILNGAEQCDDGNNIPGDGCSGLCKLEPFFECKAAGKACVSTIVCGDGKVIGDEACDDSNTKGGDGCAADCKQVEAGWSCPTAAGVGGACTMAPQDRCGDGRLTYGEFCDDGNSTNGDGCSDACKVDPGYTCAVAGMACTLIASCGDGQLSVAAGEQCDDGNKVPGDGCSALCIIETNYVCPQPGQPCVSTVKCGDRKVTGAETCDDGDLDSGDGCSGVCQVETGWKCFAGGACIPTRCGDGIKVGNEQCEDGNANSGDGCSPACRLELPGPTEADGWQCITTGQACTRTDCGNGAPEGSEQCDDGNNDTGDGCSPFCRKEPLCPQAGGACVTACGDGLLLPVDIAAGQECDDGNTISGDGCSPACKKEPGYECQAAAAVQDPLILPIIYRDFKGYGEAGGHPDFERYSGAESGIVMDALGANGKPVHVAGNKNTTSNSDPAEPGYPFDYFGTWYKDDSNYNKTFRDVLSFMNIGGGVYQYNDSNFFKLDGKGWGNYQSSGHNFHFTSEVRYWFEYKGNEQLDFTGDDDVWVFINKRLAVDLGGVHSAASGSATLNAGDGTAQVCDFVSACNNKRGINLGMQLGSVYEIVVFQAERHTNQSNYKLTLSNFSATRGTCVTNCGDGVVAGAEICDLGPGKNTGAYGTCNADCTLPARCGDAMVQSVSGETCDDGINSSVYGGTAKVCAPGCVWAAYCGDSMVDSANGEACDQGADNGKGYGYCTATCQLGPRCGDGATTDGEECDDGALNGTSGSACMAACKKKCGNGVLDAREQCDDGRAANTGGYGKCSATCTVGQRCGDGIKNGPETCDDGKNDGSYGACTAACALGPRCGDGVLQDVAGEVCDQGAANQANPYGKGKCGTTCRPSPYCGDKAVDVAFGEGCDDGVNSGDPGSCKTDCSAAIPLPSCGDGVLKVPEECDDGGANGTLASVCDVNCNKKCGNGFRDQGEACDDGKNTGAYGTCNADCTLAAYCGDTVKNGAEACDLGAGNEANPYGKGKCTRTCAAAPFCGDGRIQMSFGETCDGGAFCDASCHQLIIP